MDAIEILRNHHLKKTAQRVAIIDSLLRGKVPMSESEVKDNMGDLYERTTFYRSMQTLTEAGIIHKIVPDNLTVKYALNPCDELHRHEVDHVHFFCQLCQSVICLEQVKTKGYPLPEGYLETEKEVIIKGICKKCRK
jgi:Fur family transcriptional regulator, ferric uptake regulator